MSTSITVEINTVKKAKVYIEHQSISLLLPGDRQLRFFLNPKSLIIRQPSRPNYSYFNSYSTETFVPQYFAQPPEDVHASL
jgi:hypothetical protein